MKLRSLKEITARITSLFTVKRKSVSKGNKISAKDQAKLKEISIKSRQHLAQKKAAGLPLDGKAVFEPGRVISTKFWGKLADINKINSPERSVSGADNGVHYSQPDTNQSLRQLALQHKAKQEKLFGFDRQSFAGIPLHKIETISKKVQAYAAQNFPNQNDTGMRVVELDFTNNVAEITHYQNFAVSGVKAEFSGKMAI